MCVGVGVCGVVEADGMLAGLAGVGVCLWVCVCVVRRTFIEPSSASYVWKFARLYQIPVLVCFSVVDFSLCFVHAIA